MATETGAVHRILVVDDEPDILRLTQFLLESWGYEVTTASNGKEAIERAIQKLPIKARFVRREEGF